MVLNLALTRFAATPAPAEGTPPTTPVVKSPAVAVQPVAVQPILGMAVRQKAHTVVRKVEAIKSAQGLISAVRELDGQISKVRRDLGLLSGHELLAGDYRMFPAVFKRLLPLKGTRVRFNAGLASVRCVAPSPAEQPQVNEALNEFPGEMWTSSGPGYYRKLIADLKWFIEAREAAITKLLPLLVHPVPGKKFVLAETALADRRRDLKASRARRLRYATEIAERYGLENRELREDEWYLATTPVVIAAQQAGIDATAEKLVKAKDDHKAAKARLAQLKYERDGVDDDLIREDLSRSIRACEALIDALDRKVGNLSTKLAEQKAEANPFLKDGVKLADRPAESVAEWLSASLPDFAAFAAAEIAELRDQSLYSTYWGVRFELAESELPRIVAAVAAAKLPTKCVEHIVKEVKFGRLNLLTTGSLENAITKQSEITRTGWQKRISGVNKAIRDVMALVEKFLRLATAGELTSLDAVNRVHQILSYLEGEGNIINTLAEAKAIDPVWLVNSEGRALKVPNLPKLVLTFITDGKAELSAVSQVKLLPEWFEPPVAVKRSGRNIAPVVTVSEVAPVSEVVTAPVVTAPKPVDTRSRAERLAAEF